jgi:hypothetical protein
MVPNTRHKRARPLELDTITSYITCTPSVPKCKQKLVNKSECIWSKSLTKYIKFLWLIFTYILGRREHNILVVCWKVTNKSKTDSALITNGMNVVKILLLVNFLKERKWVGLEFGVAKHACDHNLEPCASFNHFFFLLLSFVTFTCVNCARRYILAYSGGSIATNIPTSALWAIDKLHFQTWIIVFNRPI